MPILLRDELLTAIQQSGGLGEEEVFDLLFRPPSGAARVSPPIRRKLVAEALRADPRFARTGEVWRLRDPWEAVLRKPIWKTDYAVVDIETTGYSAATSRITEIGLVKISRGAICGRWSSLIDPGVPIPAAIEHLTGITPGMLRGKPSIGAVLPRFLRLLGRAVFVAHHVPFDLSFLDRAVRRERDVPILNPTLCTVRLARRLLPGLGSKNLDSVADHLGIGIEGRHRAAGDAEATARVLLRLLEESEKRGLRTVREIIALQYAPTARAARP